VTGGRNRQEFRQTFDDAENKRFCEQNQIHADSKKKKGGNFCRPEFSGNTQALV
jgi:hypothetical protein